MVDAPHKTLWLKRAFQVIVLTLVSWGIAKAVLGARQEFQAVGFSPGDLEFEWLMAAAFFYLAGLLPFCVFWQTSLHAFGQHPGFRSTMRAYYVGNLGKYVPGKALVIIIRTALLRGSRVNTAVAATSIFVETLTMAAVGAVVAFLLLCLIFLMGQNGTLASVGVPDAEQQKLLAALAIMLALGAGLPTLPPIFRRIVRLLRVHRASENPAALLSGLNIQLIAKGWPMLTIGWLILGLSLWSVLRAIPDTPAAPLLYELCLVTACVSLAMVAGFLSLLPGGIGVREYVVMTLLSPAYGAVVAIAAAVALRIVWLIAETAAAAVLYFGWDDTPPE